MKKTFRKLLIYGTVLAVCGCRGAGQRETWEKEFADPSDIYRPQPFWHINGTLTTEGIRKQLSDAIQGDGFGGVAVLPLNPGGMWGNQGICPGTTPVYLSEGYFNRYRDILECSAEQGAQVILYDDVDFPSGTAGGKLGEQFPQYTRKRLCKTEEEAIGPKNVKIAVPLRDSFMGAAAMNTLTLERIDLGEFVTDSTLEWQVPEGTWKIMSFAMENHVDNHVDYMEPKAVKEFMKMTYDQYAERFEPYFGNTITKTFFDDVGYYGIENYWNPELSGLFEKRYGKKAALYYPALWYDIGPETASARNAMFSLRAEQYAAAYPKLVSEWSRAHGTLATGHQDNEERENPVGTSADLMKCFKYQDIPGIDKIGGDRPAERFYKVVSSAAVNWDRSLAMSETYGAMGNIPWDTIYRIAQDQYAKGINMLIPHAVWYDDRNVTFLPELSHRNPLYRDGLYEFNTFLGRLNVLLQNDARLATDIAVLYPIETMQAGHRFDGPLTAYEGGVRIPDMDYVQVGCRLTDRLGRDFIYLHPEVLASERTSVAERRLLLEGERQPQSLRTLVVPSSEVVSAEGLAKIEAFFDAGGQVIFTTRLPARSSEPGRDAEVTERIGRMLPETSRQPDGSIVRRNRRGGTARFIPLPSAEALAEALEIPGEAPDIGFAAGTVPLRCMHKVLDGRDIYYLANLSDSVFDSTVALRGEKRLEIWNPHTGEIAPADSESGRTGRDRTTEVRLRIEPNRSLFLVEKIRSNQHTSTKN